MMQRYHWLHPGRDPGICQHKEVGTRLEGTVTHPSQLPLHESGRPLLRRTTLASQFGLCLSDGCYDLGGEGLPSVLLCLSRGAVCDGLILAGYVALLGCDCRYCSGIQ